jgi:F-type H+-transporting ATPase subunit alpha
MPRDQEREREIGFVVEATQYVLTLEGLPSAKIGDVIVHENGGRALVQSLLDDRLMALALDPMLPRAGDQYEYLPDQNIFSLGDHLFGRVVSPLGEPVDGGAPFPPGNAPLALDVEAPGIEARVAIHEPLPTGITVIDTLLPIAKGQRQLLFGPVRGGKTDFLIDIVLNQQDTGMVCIYALIGKSLSELERIESRILREGKGRNLIVAALSDQPAPAIAIAPSAALLIADYFERQGRDVLVVLDDLDLHAKYLREIGLLENRLPGRESYPGDLFYQQAHLMERSGHFEAAYGGGTITLLPVIETDPYASLGIVSTNLMSCTDGHLAFVASLQSEGVYPAIADDQSITRIGRNAQKLLARQLATRLRTTLAEVRRERQYAQFGGQVSQTTAAILTQGEAIEMLLRQEPGNRIPLEIQVPLLALALTRFIVGKDGAFIARTKPALIRGLGTDPALVGVRDAAVTDTPLEEYLAILEPTIPTFEALCRA